MVRSHMYKHYTIEQSWAAISAVNICRLQEDINLYIGTTEGAILEVDGFVGQETLKKLAVMARAITGKTIGITTPANIVEGPECLQVYYNMICEYTSWPMLVVDCKFGKDCVLAYQKLLSMYSKRIEKIGRGNL